MRNIYIALIILIVTLGIILWSETRGSFAEVGPTCALTPAGDVAACN